MTQRPEHRRQAAAATIGWRSALRSDDSQTILEVTLAPNSVLCDLRFLVGMAGFEPAASCSQSRRANQAAPHPVEPTVAYPPIGQAPRRRGAHMACVTTVTLRGSARSRRTKPRHSALPGPARAVRPRCRETATLSMLTRCQTQPSAGTRGRSSMAEPQPSKLVMRVRFPSPAPTCKPRSAALMRTRLWLLGGVEG